MSGASLIMATHDTSVIDQTFNVVHIQDNLFEEINDDKPTKVTGETQLLSTSNGSSVHKKVPSNNSVSNDENPKNKWVKNQNQSSSPCIKSLTAVMSCSFAAVVLT